MGEGGEAGEGEEGGRDIPVGGWVGGWVLGTRPRPPPCNTHPPEVRKSWVAAMRISPLLGVHRLWVTPIRCRASARASSVCVCARA